MKLLVSIGFTFFLCIVSIISYLAHLFLTAAFSILGNWIYLNNNFFGEIFMDLFHNFALFFVYFISSYFLRFSAHYSSYKILFYFVFSTFIAFWQIKLIGSFSVFDNFVVYLMPGLAILLSVLVRK